MTTKKVEFHSISVDWSETQLLIGTVFENKEKKKIVKTMVNVVSQLMGMAVEEGDPYFRNGLTTCTPSSFRGLTPTPMLMSMPTTASASITTSTRYRLPGTPIAKPHLTITFLITIAIITITILIIFIVITIIIITITTIIMRFKNI